MRLDADTYHTELTGEQRQLVDAWLRSVFGPAWRDQMVWAYEVVGEGQVRFEHGVGRVTTIESMPTPPPPIWNGARKERCDV